MLRIQLSVTILEETFFKKKIRNIPVLQLEHWFQHLYCKHKPW